jgi:hypothetical protein
VALNSLSPLQNKNSTQKKDSRTNLVVALLAVLLKKLKQDQTADITLAHNASCSLQFVQTAETKPKFLSNLLVIDPYIAVIVINPHVITGRI